MIQNKCLPRIIEFDDLDSLSDSADKKSEAPTVAKPTMIVNIPSQWRTDTSRRTNIFEKIAVKIITAPESKINKILKLIIFNKI